MNDGTAYNFGQYNEVLVAMVRALPKALESTDPKKLLASLKGRGVILEEALGKMFVSLVTVVPADDEWFDLEVDYDVDPLEVVCSAGYNPENWKFLGPAQKGRVTERVKFIRLGRVRNVQEAEERASGHGYRLPGGHGREPFTASYPTPDGKGPVVFGGSRWRYPGGYAYVTYLYALKVGWDSLFDWAGNDFSEDCRWPVASK